jgi:hypothetical protein
MRHEIVADVVTYWIAHGVSKSNGILDIGQHLASGEEYLETFTSYRPYLSRWVELGGNAEDAPPKG